MRLGWPTKVVIGAWTSVTPQSNGNDTTDMQCFIFSLVPDFQIFHQERFTGMHCNNSLSTKDGKPKGFGFCRDGDSDRFRLRVNEKFGLEINNCIDVFGDEQFESVKSLKLNNMECWGTNHPSMHLDMEKAHKKEQEIEKKNDGSILNKQGSLMVNFQKDNLKNPTYVGNAQHVSGGLTNNNMSNSLNASKQVKFGGSNMPAHPQIMGPQQS